MRAAKRAIAATFVAAFASCALAGSAFAATVGGADFYGTGSALESGSVDVLNVDGSAGEAIFITVKAGDTVLARNLPYTIGASAAAGDEATWAGIATLDITNLNLDALDGTYTIEAYASRAGDELLYSGALYGVYADLPEGETRLIGTRTVNASEMGARTFNPPDTVFAGGRTYRLSGEAPGEGGALHFAYEEYDEATTVDGVVKFTNAAGEVISSTKIPGLEYGEERTVGIPSIVTADNGDVYRTVYFKDSVTAVNPGQTSFNIYCTQVSESDQARAGFYLAKIRMVDADGHVIASDSVNVTGEFAYTAPSTIYKTEMIDGEATVVSYEFTPTDEMPSAFLPMSAAQAAAEGFGSEHTYTFLYTAQPRDAAQATVTFNLLDGSKRVNEQGRILGTQTIVANDENPTVVPEAQLDVNGTTYYLVGDPSDYAYTLHAGMVPSVDAFYVPEGYEPPGAYDVTVNYVNFLTGDVVESHSYTSDPNDNARIIIETPAEFSADGIDYVRLDGQEADIQHSYYSGIASYTVYYRDVNDTLTSGTVINTIRVVYVDGTVEGGTPAEGGVVLIEGDAAGDATGGAADDGATALQLNAGRTYNVFDGADNNSMLTNESGVDSNTERIEDMETPLASGANQGGTSSAAASFMATASWVLPVALAVIVALIALFAFLARRRRKNSDMYEM